MALLVLGEKYLMSQEVVNRISVALGSVGDHSSLREGPAIDRFALQGGG